MRGYDEFEAAFDRLLGLAYRHARRLVGDDAVAEDLASEALIRTYVRWPTVRSYEFLDAWVLRVVTNLAIDALSARRASLPPNETIGPEDVVLLRVTLAEARKAPATLE